MRSCRGGDEHVDSAHSRRGAGGGLNRPHLFRHPVGVFPAGARWYLASIAILALLGVGMHLSVQQQAQLQAEALIHKWGRDAGVEIANVRYHLLRNGLVLQNIQARRGEESLTIRHILIHANPQLLTGSHPRIGDVTVSGVDVTLDMRSGESVWLHEQAFLQLWQATRSFSLGGGRLAVYAAQGSDKPLVFSDVNFHLNTRDAVRLFSVSARLGGGQLQGTWSQSAGHTQGKSSWQQLDASLLTTRVGLHAIPGQLNGAFDWTSTAAGDHQSGSSDVEGQVQLSSAVGTSRSRTLQWHAIEHGGQWLIDTKAEAWPLRPWSAVLPHLAGRELTAGHFDGVLHWQGKPGAWMVNSEHGTLYDLTYAADQRQAWYWSQISYEQANFDTSEHSMHIDSAELDDSRLVLDTQSLPDNAATTNQWRVSAGKMTINNMMLALSLPHGKVMLPELNGRSSWPADEPLSFDLMTAKTTSLPAQAISEWHLKGSTEGGERVAADFNVVGRHVSLPLLRALLPFRVDEGHGTSLAGSAELNIDVSIRQGQWQMQGRAAARDLRLSHGGSIWSAANASVAFGPVGMGLDFQQISSIEADGWHYVTALQPLTATVQGDQQDSAARQLPWWMTALRENHCRIDRLHWQDGTLSIGRNDAHWAEKIDVDMQHIAPDDWAETKIHGVAGGAPFSLDGEWDLFSDYGRIRGTGRINNALPFFLSDWMRASGMPQLIRGRLSAAISLSSPTTPENWMATVTLTLKRGLFEKQEAPSDPMLARTGYKTAELLYGLQNDRMLAGVSYTAGGRWSELTLESLGEGLQQALRNGMHRHAMLTADERVQKRIMAEKRGHLETRIRLHDNKRLSLNERTRLHKVMVKAHNYPEMMIDLRPEWTGATLSATEAERIRETQQAVERYLIHRNIDVGRIYPLRPSASSHVEESGSVWVETAP
ncbi:hypothetical protein [Mariprofundus ferrooxydans]|nr:hypothetical protein [Mariprofundus ferrooxydans]KON47518.1 hypothetical protein AL013_07210 [Mariprofundus ferrooxydans]